VPAPFHVEVARKAGNEDLCTPSTQASQGRSSRVDFLEQRLAEAEAQNRRLKQEVTRTAALEQEVKRLLDREKTLLQRVAKLEAVVRHGAESEDSMQTDVAPDDGSGRRAAAARPAPAPLPVAKRPSVPRLDMTKVGTEDDEYVLDETFVIDAPGFQGTWSTAMSGCDGCLSSNGRVVRRGPGQRSFLALGSSCFPPETGQYFAVRITEVAAGAVGGLGIGFSCTPSDQVKRVTERGYRVPGTTLVGYWGRLFVGGHEYRLNWTGENLAAGDVVGILATFAGDIVLFVNDVTQVVIASVIPDVYRSQRAYPMVDLYGSTVAAEILNTPAPQLKGKPSIFAFADMTKVQNPSTWGAGKAAGNGGRAAG